MPSTVKQESTRQTGTESPHASTHQRSATPQTGARQGVHKARVRANEDKKKGKRTAGCAAGAAALAAQRSPAVLADVVDRRRHRAGLKDQSITQLRACSANQSQQRTAFGRLSAQASALMQMIGRSQEEMESDACLDVSLATAGRTRLVCNQAHKRSDQY